MKKIDENIFYIDDDNEFDESQKAALKALAEVDIPLDLHEKMMQAVMDADKPKKMPFGRVAAAFSGVAAAVVLVVSWVILWDNDEGAAFGDYDMPMAVAGAGAMDMAEDDAWHMEARIEMIESHVESPSSFAYSIPSRTSDIFIFDNYARFSVGDLEELELTGGSWAMNLGDTHANFTIEALQQGVPTPFRYYDTNVFLETWGEWLSREQVITVRDAREGIVRLQPTADGRIVVTMMDEGMVHIPPRLRVIIETFENFYANMPSPKDYTAEEYSAMQQNFLPRGVFFEGHYWRPHAAYHVDEFLSLYITLLEPEQVEALRRYEHGMVRTYVRDDGQVVVVLRSSIE
ncbi:MAG: hypothetical protein FWC69_04295 [Defluviitaleaceae bacterium]|nr:hypothetical protein [Defluviitaleaceae bacterium]